MGAKLAGYFDIVGKELGFEGRMKLAMLTKIPSSQAQTTEDSASNIQMFEQMLAKVRQEMPKR